MFKRVMKSIFLYFYFKKNNIKSFSYFVSHKANIGRNTEIGRNTGIDSLCEIGMESYIGKNCYLTKVRIGNYCSIANNISIGQGEHDIDSISTSSLFYDNSYDDLTKDDCIIGNDVWIGVDAIVLRGVRIGNGVVVGANSVVTKDVPDFAVVVGSPAKVIKYRFNKEKQEKILGSKWWEKNLDEAKQIIHELEKNK